MWHNYLKEYFEASHNLQLQFIRENIELLQKVIDMTIATLENGNKILVAGNGGSAADAQHFVAELVGRFMKDRRGLPAVALTTNTSTLTALANDYGYEQVFAHQVESLGKEGDLLYLISTSGNSPNLLEAAQVARKMGIKTVALLGKGGGKLKHVVDIALIVPSNCTPHIQECHVVIYHSIAGAVERHFFGDDNQ